MKFRFAVTAAVAAILIAGCEDVGETVENGVVEVENAAGHHEENKPSFRIVSFGSPNVSGAKEVQDVQIAGLKVNGTSGLSFSYKTGSLAALGSPNNSTAGALAVAGWQQADGSWKCGKFDWISQSRRTRDFNNINTRYNGWDPNAFHAAKKHCFFIMSADGKKRSNIITD